MMLTGMRGRWSGLGHWNLYFLAKLLLAWQGSLVLSVLPNLLLAAVLLLPLTVWPARLRTLLAVPAALALLYQESPLPAPEHLAVLASVQNLSIDELLEQAGQRLDAYTLGAIALGGLGYYLLAPWLRLTSLSLAGLLWLAALELPAPAFWSSALPVSVQAVSDGSAPAGTDSLRVQEGSAWQPYPGAAGGTDGR